MNEKIGIQNLLAALTEKSDKSDKDIEIFTQEFFQLIVEALEHEKYVKIKGLGTFKLIDVDSRESIDVNTGERIEIKSHTKISFTPDNALRDIINRPFAHFETVVLNDNVVLDNTSIENATDNEEENITAIEDISLPSEYEETATQEVSTNEKEEELQDTHEGLKGSEVVEKQNILSENQQATQERKIAQAEKSFLPLENPVLYPKDINEKKEKSEEQDRIEHQETEKIETEIEQTGTCNLSAKPKSSSSYKVFITLIAIIIILCIGSIIYIYWPNTEIDEYKSNPTTNEQTINNSSDSIECSETEEEKLASDTLQMSDSTKIQLQKGRDIKTNAITLPQASNTSEKKATQKSSKQEPAFTSDSVGYEIVGTETNYTIKDGDTLTKIALHFWGTKSLWPYIVKHNAGIIKNPDNVPYGTTIKIPKLKKK